MLKFLLRSTMFPIVGLCLISMGFANTPAAQSATKSGEKNKVTVEVLFATNLPTYVDPYKENIVKHIVAAVHGWTDNFDVKRPCTVTVLIESKMEALTGGPYIRTPTGDKSGRQFKRKPIVESGAAHELRTGDDPNGNDPDIGINAGKYDLERMWFDPDIEQRNSGHISDFAIPTDPDWQKSKTDAYTMFLHELGHAFGLLSQGPGSNEITVYDQFVFEHKGDQKRVEFIGPNAVKANGGTPVAMQNAEHVSNAYYEQGDHNIMGPYWKPSVRISAPPVTVAMLADCGLKPKKPIASPPFKNRRIVYALYGTDGGYKDVTDVVGAKIVNNKLSFTVNDESLGVKLDTDQKKYFRIKIVSGGMAVYEQTFAEGSRVEYSDIELASPRSAARTSRAAQAGIPKIPQDS